VLTGEQVQAARIMAHLKQPELAERAGVSLGTVKRLEQTEGLISANVNTVVAIQRALEAAGVVFILDGDGMGPGVRLRDPAK
jgi:transcriptional regulator with XRE-family HTH domain